ncbi:unnamed protein product [Camellia sinensis]
MDESLIGAAQTGDVETLYNLIQGDPFVLDKIDQVPFVDTPLHVAISANQTHFAKEIASLKPSFVVKLNQYGYSHSLGFNGWTSRDCERAHHN